MDLRNRHLEFWTPFSDDHPRECNSKTLTYHQWCALPAQRALVTHPPCRLPRYMLLDLPRDVIHSVTRFRLCVHPLCFETTTWNLPLPLLATCVRLMMKSRMKTCSLLLHAPSDAFFLQEVHVLIFTDEIPRCVCVFTPGKQQPPSSSVD